MSSLIIKWFLRIILGLNSFLNECDCLGKENFRFSLPYAGSDLKLTSLLRELLKRSKQERDSYLKS